MGHIERRAPGKWRARYRAPDGRERSCTFARKADAEAFLAGVEADMARGQYVDPAGGRRTSGDQAWEWRAVQLHRPTTAAQVDSHLRNHVLPFFDARPLASIRPSEIQAWQGPLRGAGPGHGGGGLPVRRRHLPLRGRGPAPGREPAGA